MYFKPFYDQVSVGAVLFMLIDVPTKANPLSFEKIYPGF